MSKCFFSFKYFIILLMVSQYSVASELLIARSFNIKAVNGSIYEQGLIDQERRLNLRDGKNLIAIEYEEVFDSDDGENFDIIKSTPFLLSVYLQKDTVYQQKIAKPANVEAARNFAINPLFEIVTTLKDGQQHRINFNLVALQSSATSYLLQQTRLPPNKTISLSNPFTKDARTSIFEKEDQTDFQSTSTATQMLMYWWQQATPEEKSQFLNSVKNDQ